MTDKRAADGSPAAVQSVATFLKHLAAPGNLSLGESTVLNGLSGRQQHHVAHAELCAEGEIPEARMLLSGWACRQHLMRDGRRQIIGFILPGDTIGPFHQASLPSSCAAVALTPAVSVDARDLLRAIGAEKSLYPTLWLVLHRMACLQEIWLRDQIVRLGRRSAYERTVHLVLELHRRLSAVGLAVGTGFDWPLTQDVLADALGLSVVHINRVLAMVRRDGLFELHDGRVVIHSLQRMMNSAPENTPHLLHALGGS